MCRMGWRPLAVVAGVAVAGCGDGAGAATPDVLVDTVQGAERLSYGAAGPTLEWTVDTVAVIGEAMGEDEYQFGSLPSEGVTGGLDGHVLALDRQAGRVLEYGPDGRHVATYGRKGSGPGELTFPGGMDLGPGDTLWVTDLMNRRLTGFPRQGGDPRTIPYADVGAFPSARVEAVSGGFLQTVGAFGRSEAEAERGVPLVRFDRQLQPADTLWVAPPEPTDVVQTELNGRRMILNMTQEFWPDFAWRALSDGGVVVSDTADYLVRVLNPDGSVRRVIRRDPPARATTEEDREAVKRRVLAEADSGQGISFGGSGPDPAAQRRMAEQRIEKMTFASRIPRIRGLRVDPADRIWVAVTSDADPTQTERIDVYDRDGRLLGELRDFPFPSGFAGSDRLLTVRTDELGVPQLVVMRVPQMGDDGADRRASEN